MKLRIQATVALFAIFAIFSAYQGITDIRSSTVSDVTELYGTFAEGPLVLLLPLVAALLAGLPIATRIQSRFYASTRTRIDMSSLLLRDVAIGVGLTALFCLGLSLVWHLLAFYVAEPLFPDAINHANYAGTESGLHGIMIDQAPLSRAYIDGGPWAFAAVAMAWMSFHGAVFALLSAACAIVIPHRIIALIAPLALVVVQSLGAAILNYGSVSWMVTALYPNGMQRILPLEALAPTAILLVLISACLTVFIVRAPHSPKFA